MTKACVVLRLQPFRLRASVGAQKNRAHIMRRFLPLALATIITACAATGVKVDPSQTASFKPGQTTYAEVIAKLGPPTSQTQIGTGQRFISYTYARSAARPETFIPIVGAFVGGADTQAQSVMFRFDANGVLVDTTSSSHQMGSGTGFMAGPPAPRTAQPTTAP